MPLKEMTGKFGRLTVVSFQYVKKESAYWLFKCECGTKKVIRGQSVRGGLVKSCGCLHSEMAREQQRRVCYKHGRSHTKVFYVWASLRGRCNNKNDNNYFRYGGRGIKVCRRWSTFENFYKDMGEVPAGKTLDRIDNNKGYSPKNCRWATRKEQANNRRSTVKITRLGKTMSLKEWCSENGLSYKAVHCRVKKGWPLERALTYPLRSSANWWDLMDKKNGRQTTTGNP